MARPARELNLEQVYNIGKLLPTDAEAAAALLISERTLLRRKKHDARFREALAQGRAAGGRPAPLQTSDPPQPDGSGGTRPAVAWDLAKVERVARLMLTGSEAALALGISPRTLRQRLGEKSFRTAFEQGRNRGRMMIRKAQMKSALSGNARMLVLLGIKHLGETAKGRDSSAGGIGRSNHNIYRSSGSGDAWDQGLRRRP